MEQKGQIFFFGRPGCLKQSIPIRTNSEEEAEKKNEDSVDLKDKVESIQPTQTSDEDTDGDELMKRISEVLDDEPGNSQNHNDKSNDLKSMENCENASVNKNDHEKLANVENNDNMISALETLSENNITESSSMNTEELSNNVTEKCSEVKTKSNSDESPASGEVSANENLKENNYEHSEIIEESSSENIEKPCETIEAQNDENDSASALQESSECAETIESKEPSNIETESTELPEKSEEISTNVSSSESDIETPKETVSQEPEPKDNSENAVETPTECQLSESMEEPMDISYNAPEESSQSITEPLATESTDQNQDLYSESIESSLQTESQIDESENGQTISEPNNLEIAQNPSSEIEILPPKRDTSIPESCDIESNQNVEEMIQIEESSLSQTQEIDSKSEPMATSEINENTQNNNEMTEEPSITKVLDSNKNETSCEEISNESINEVVSEQHEIIEPLVEHKTDISENIEVNDSGLEENSEIPQSISQIELNEKVQIKPMETSNDDISSKTNLENSDDKSEAVVDQSIEDQPEVSSSHQIKTDFKSDDRIETKESIPITESESVEVIKEPLVEVASSKNAGEEKTTEPIDTSSDEFEAEEFVSDALQSEVIQEQNIASEETIQDNKASSPESITPHEEISTVEKSEISRENSDEPPKIEEPLESSEITESNEDEVEIESTHEKLPIPYEQGVETSKNIEIVEQESGPLALEQESSRSLSKLPSDDSVDTETQSVAHSTGNISREEGEVEVKQSFDTMPDEDDKLVVASTENISNEESNIAPTNNLGSVTDNDDELDDDITKTDGSPEEQQLESPNLESTSEVIEAKTTEQVSDETLNLKEDHEAHELSIENSTPIENDNQSISSIEEHKGVEVCEPRSEDISIAEEAIPKEEILVESPSEISEKSEHQVPLHENETINEPSISKESPQNLEIKSAILPQENIEELNAKVDDIPKTDEDLSKSDENEIEDPKSPIKEIVEAKVSSPVELAERELSPEPELQDVEKEGDLKVVEEIEQVASESKTDQHPSTSEESNNEIKETLSEPPPQNEEVKEPAILQENKELKEPEISQLETSKDEIQNSETKPQETSLFDEIKETDQVPITKSQIVTRKRKISERKSISESDSDGGSHFVSESVSQDPESDIEEAVQRKKPRIRGKVITPRRKLPTRQSARVSDSNKTTEPSKAEEKLAEKEKSPEIESSEKTIQNFKFDYDENEDVVANIAAIKTLICKDKEQTKEEEEPASSDEDTPKKKPGRPGRKAKRGRPAAKKVEHEASSSEDEDNKSSKMPDSKRSKTSESEEPPKEPVKKKRETKKGLLRDLDTSLVIETIDNEAPVRASRRIAQQKIKEETERRLMEERMLKQMKEEAEKKKKGVSQSAADDDEKSDSDESYKGGAKKKKAEKKKLKTHDKWQSQSSHSEHSETDPEEYEHHHYEDPGSPLFRSDHEFSPESEDDDATPVQPVKRARTAKKQVEESSDEEDVNPNHACQVCHKTDSPEWILLCDECDCGYHCSCLKPIIFCIPSGNWYCPLCCHKKLIVDLGTQLEKLDVLVETIQFEELRKQKQIEAQKLAEITEQNILNERRKNRSGATRDDEKEGSQDEQSSEDESSSNDNDNDKNSSSDSSDDAPLIYKLRKRSQATASYRFNDYDDLINSAIRDEMEEVKGLGNAGRGKDISTIIEADKEEKKQQKLEKERAASGIGEKKMPSDAEKEEGESSGSEIVRSKKSLQKKKKNRKLNNLEDTSEEEGSDDDFKGSSSSNSDSDEEFSASSVSESSLDLPLKKSKVAPRSTRNAARNRRYDEKFIDDNSSDDEPLVKKRNKKKSDSEEEFDLEDDGSGSTAEEVDSEDLCDDTDTSDSSEGNWPRKKKRVASYDKKPRKPAKKHDEDDDKAFRAGISKKKILEKKTEENESEGSGSEKATGRRKTRGKKLLYIMEDDFEESDDGIKPGVGVVRPETPPEEREQFRKKQEEIKKMLAAKNTEGARKLAVPTIEPIKFDMEMPKSPSPPPIPEGSSLSTIPKDVIQGAKALDFDFNRIKPVHSSSLSKAEMQPEMSEEELAKMMEEEDFAQHQLKLAGEAIRKQQALLELEGKEEAFAAYSKTKLKDEKPVEVPIESPKKRAKKPKVEKAPVEPVKAPEVPKHPEPHSRPIPHQIPSTQALHPTPPHAHPVTSAPPPLISNIPHSQPPLHAPYSNLPPSRFPMNPNQPLPPHNLQERPSVLSSFLAGHPRPEMHSRPDIHPQQPMNFHRQGPPEAFIPKGPPHLPPHIQHQPPMQQAIPTQPPVIPSQPQSVPEEKEKKGGRRKKFTPLRQDLPEANVSKVAKLDTPQAPPTSVIADDKNKAMPPALQRPPKATVAVASPPQIFNPGTSPTPSVITRLIQQQPSQSPQQRLGPYAGFNEHIGSDNAPSSQPTAASRAYPSTDEIKHLAAAAAANKQSRPSPQAPFNENPFVPRTMHHTLYRAPPTSQSIYGIPPHARLPYPFHLPPHPNNNLRPNMQDYASSPYGIPPQFAYYGAPPAHSRQPPQNAAGTTPPITHPISQHPEGVHHPPGHPRGNEAENPQQQTPSEFGGLVSYFSSQQELD